MSDSDQKYLLHPGWLDLESDLPLHSSVDSTIKLGQTRAVFRPTKPKLSPGFKTNYTLLIFVQLLL